MTRDQEMDATPPPIDIPPADSPGGTGAQTAGSIDITTFIPRNHFDGVVDAVKGLAEGKPRSIGGDATAALLAGLVTTLRDELKTARDSLQDQSERADRAREELSTIKAKNSALIEKIESSSRAQTLTQVMMTVASILIGVSVDAFKSSTQTLAIVTGLMAIGLLVSGWVVPRLKGSSNV